MRQAENGEVVMRLILSFLILVIATVGCHRINEVDPHQLPSAGTRISPSADSTHHVTSAPFSQEPPAADNTAANRRDRDATFKTPFDQSENSKDLKITAEIRQRLVNDKHLSVNGRNIKIITAENKVTLRGPVSTEAERDRIATIAKEVAGDTKVENQLELTSNKPEL